jgi:hypothetical protein
MWVAVGSGLGLGTRVGLPTTVFVLLGLAVKAAINGAVFIATAELVLALESLEVGSSSLQAVITKVSTSIRIISGIAGVIAFFVKNLFLNLLFSSLV